MANPNNNGNGNGNGGGQPAPRPRPTLDEARKNLDHAVESFTKVFPRRNGGTFAPVEDGPALFNALVEANDGDGLALYLENPVQLLLSLVFSLRDKITFLETARAVNENSINALQGQLTALTARVQALERRP